MTTKRLVMLTIVLLVVTAVFAGGGREAGASAGDRPVKITWSSISVPADAHTRAMWVFKTELERLTDNRISVELFTAGQIFTQEAELAAAREGSLDMAYFSAAWFAEWVPYLSMLEAVYAFSGWEHANRVLNGEIGQEIFDEVARVTGVRPLGAFYLGTRTLNLRDIGREVRRPQDMRGVNLRVPASPAMIALGRALGANPTPMSFGEVYMGLRTGTIDGQDNPLPTTRNANFYEVTKYIVLTNHVVGTVWPSMNERKWQSLSEEDRQLVMKAIATAGEICAQLNLEAESKLLGFFREQGMVIIEDIDREAFAQYATNSYQTESRDVSSKWDWALWERIQALR